MRQRRNKLNCSSIIYIPLCHKSSSAPWTCIETFQCFTQHVNVFKTSATTIIPLVLLLSVWMKIIFKQSSIIFGTFQCKTLLIIDYVYIPVDLSIYITFIEKTKHNEHLKRIVEMFEKLARDNQQLWITMNKSNKSIIRPNIKSLSYCYLNVALGAII